MTLVFMHVAAISVFPSKISAIIEAKSRLNIRGGRYEPDRFSTGHVVLCGGSSLKDNCVPHFSL